MSLVRVSELLVESHGLAPGRSYEEDVSFQCPRCDRWWTAADALLGLNKGRTEYQCRDDHQNLVTIDRDRKMTVHREMRIDVAPA